MLCRLSVYGKLTVFFTEMSVKFLARKTAIRLILFQNMLEGKITRVFKYLNYLINSQIWLLKWSKKYEDSIFKIWHGKLGKFEMNLSILTSIYLPT